MISTRKLRIISINLQDSMYMINVQDDIYTFVFEIAQDMTMMKCPCTIHEMYMYPCQHSLEVCRALEASDQFQVSDDNKIQLKLHTIPYWGSINRMVRFANRLSLFCMPQWSDIWQTFHSRFVNPPLSYKREHNPVHRIPLRGENAMTQHSTQPVGFNGRLTVRTGRTGPGPDRTAPFPARAPCPWRHDRPPKPRADRQRGARGSHPSGQGPPCRNAIRFARA